MKLRYLLTEQGFASFAGGLMYDDGDRSLGLGDTDTPFFQIYAAGKWSFRMERKNVRGLCWHGNSPAEMLLSGSLKMNFKAMICCHRMIHTR